MIAVLMWLLLSELWVKCTLWVKTKKLAMKSYAGCWEKMHQHDFVPFSPLGPIGTGSTLTPKSWGDYSWALIYKGSFWFWDCLHECCRSICMVGGFFRLNDICAVTTTGFHFISIIMEVPHYILNIWHDTGEVKYENYAVAESLLRWN